MLYVWLFVLILSVIAEALTTALFAVWFAIGAVMAMICSSFGFGVSVQVTVFATTSLILLFCFVKKIKKDMFRTNKTNLDAVIGSVCIVEDDIPENGKGRVVLNHQSWSAKEENGKKIKKGELVEVIEIQGVTLLCKKKERGE